MRRSTSRILTLSLAAALFAVCAAPRAEAAPKPSFPPLPGEVYPVSNSKFPKEMTNPNAHTRQMTFRGAPLDIFTKIDMVTQIVLPSPPVMVNIGKQDAFTLEVIPEFNSVFVKPLRQVEKTNIIVTTQSGGVYLFILKETPWDPWDIRCEIKDPQRKAEAEDTQAVVNMLYTGRRAPEYQFVSMDMRSPESSAFVFDPLTRMGCSITLKRALSIPKYGLCGYWIVFKNILPQDTALPSASYNLSERSVWAKGIDKVALQGYRNGDSFPLLEKGDKVNMFIFTKGSALPDVFNFRFAMMGSKNIPVDAALPTNTKDSPAKTAVREKTVDERLQEMYDELVRKGKIKPAEPEDLAGVKSGQSEEPEDGGQAAGGSEKPLNTIPVFPAP